jgi:hypothetical protein
MDFDPRRERGERETGSSHSSGRKENNPSGQKPFHRAGKKIISPAEALHRTGKKIVYPGRRFSAGRKENRISGQTPFCGQERK